MRPFFYAGCPVDCRGRSFVQLWLAHAVRVSFRSSPEGEICCEVV